MGLSRQIVLKCFCLFLNDIQEHILGISSYIFSIHLLLLQPVEFSNPLFNRDWHFALKLDNAGVRWKSEANFISGWRVPLCALTSSSLERTLECSFRFINPKVRQTSTSNSSSLEENVQLIIRPLHRSHAGALMILGRSETGHTSSN